jgi:hypothetical protein
MKTTLDIDDRLLRKAKRVAAARGLTLKSLVEEALRGQLLPRPSLAKRYKFDLPVVADSAPPAVDVADRQALYDMMEGRR